MSKGYFNEDGLWVTAYKQHQDELKLDALVTTALFEHAILDINDREFLLEAGYNPDNGEYNGD